MGCDNNISFGSFEDFNEGNSGLSLIKPYKGLKKTHLFGHLDESRKNYEFDYASGQRLY